ncbi:hypothetical protein [uncultured Piscinibacter sp.]|uniref:hypothetical protein n=1 Tax=uncultured Piscinibacter sp. TaxID=1131835 RepID=UPI00263016EC|nr:hypothetical protein [uncultured Piscinibacter sp.]
MSTDHPYCPPEAAEIAAGAVDAQQLAEGIAAGRLKPDSAWLCFLQLQARHGGIGSAACRSFVLELAKRAGARS